LSEPAEQPRLGLHERKKARPGRDRAEVFVARCAEEGVEELGLAGQKRCHPESRPSSCGEPKRAFAGRPIDEEER
jgi:hypothetical protein